MNSVWSRWRRITQKVASIQADIVLTIIFFLFVIPLGLIIRLFFKERLYGYGYNQKKNSYWIKKEKNIQNKAWAKKQ